ncbi:aldehyde dehydrogenase family protein [Mesorhizobium sp. M8A.F.Ca.ET.208.01.1.1]|uniref:aldehyde dehydrogenase family protein n=1 Tax=unclassified Mesorhizobium TaxID=325217 RepID=UPI0010935C7F|nr:MULTISPECIES: aldehyde dehydrogenase family protein [unclassified Mesorhizobium]TGQ89082.1 aldehyde dehydrogenase family protein [Mesorhizobium sp. M8A.F.Ca.ET.208.01.1.1]TGR32187.1 aldehyde dehydrogenase family protein [Mesorhizobium sp. M8A.F.Ca.ET.202.01.1.1]TGT50402.1 aldehyde dehydrogenase family protein [Mesorhizobium sp. M8A.F.Ca.ET.167.01.1.1]TGU40065.1 aldehyde dehydrogenase family protein [bacterium M00.F.Ca.ET.156.01.1.1]
MDNNLRFYIDGKWVDPVARNAVDVIDPATEEPVARINLGTAEDVDRAVKAARKAFPAFSRRSKAERIDLLNAITDEYRRRFEDVSQAMMLEMGSPINFSRELQAASSLSHLKSAVKVLKTYEFEQMLDKALIVREPIGVCGFITPWNWPLNQIMAKLASALAAGCTSVVKPSEFSPLSAIILAEILHEAGTPAGVFNLVNGDGPTVGHAISTHPDVDMVSFTGSTRAGIQVAIDAAATVKRVHQELGGKSANILLPGNHLGRSVPAGVIRAFRNSGQSCQAPTRMLVHENQLDECLDLAKSTVAAMVVGDPRADRTTHGPLVNKQQFDRVQSFIETGIKEGARLVVGGLGRPEGLNRGYFVRPTVFAGVTREMTIAQQEIFGPVLSVMTYRDEDEAIDIANDSIFGLAGHVFADDVGEARRVGRRIRAGRIYLNNGPSEDDTEYEAPFGGYKQSGNGREVGVFGLEEFLETKAIMD